MHTKFSKLTDINAADERNTSPKQFKSPSLPFLYNARAGRNDRTNWQARAEEEKCKKDAKMAEQSMTELDLAQEKGYKKHKNCHFVWPCAITVLLLQRIKREKSINQG